MHLWPWVAAPQVDTLSRSPPHGSAPLKARITCGGRNQPRELSIDLVADERLGRVTGRAGGLVTKVDRTDDSRRMPGEWVRRASSCHPIRQEWHSICAATSANCQTPILVLPEDAPGHPYAVAMQTVRLAPKRRRSASTHGRPPRTRSPWRCATSASSCGAHRPAAAATQTSRSRPPNKVKRAAEPQPRSQR